MFGGLKKIIRKNKGGLKRAARAAVKVGLTAAAGVVAAKAAQVGSGVVTKALTHRDRVKNKQLKQKLLTQAQTAEIGRPELKITASRETNPPSVRPGGARATKGRTKSSAMAMPGGMKIKPTKMSDTVAIARGFDKGMRQLRAEVAAQKKHDRAERVRREKERKAALKAEKAAKGRYEAEKRRMAKLARAQAAREKKKATAAEKAAKKQGTIRENVVSGIVGAKLSGRGTQAARLGQKLTKRVSSAVSRKVGALARTGARMGAAAPRAAKIAKFARGPQGAAVVIGAPLAVKGGKKLAKAYVADVRKNPRGYIRTAP